MGQRLGDDGSDITKERNQKISAFYIHIEILIIDFIFPSSSHTTRARAIAQALFLSY